MTAQMATMLSSGWRIMAISPSKGFMGTYWEQETHWQSAMLLKGSGFVCSIVNLDKMNNTHDIFLIITPHLRHSSLLVIKMISKVFLRFVVSIQNKSLPLQTLS